MPKSQARSNQPPRDRGQKPAGRAAAVRRRNQQLALVVGLACLAAMAFLLWPRPAAGPASVASGASADRVQAAPALGPADAPVTIVEYADFGCTTCRGWEKAGVLQQIRAAYADRVRFVWRDFPVITPQSPKAAEAAQCAFDQGKFWEYHDRLYARAPALAIDDLKRYAGDLGLDTARFNACLDSGQNQAVVEAGQKEAVAHGFIGTPSFLVNGQPVIGPQPFEVFKRLIDVVN
jgi:protein-disulfide isomerase